jgi:sugar/nucleoside kinase (ribokinase family)
MASDIIVVGNAGLDTQIYLPTSRLDLGREAHFCSNVDCVGQAGGYASRGYAALGLKTSYFGTLGQDAAGDIVRQQLSAEGIDLSGVFLDPHGTARSINLVYPDGHRNCFYDGRGHMDLTADASSFRAVALGARLAHFNLPNWARTLLPEAREMGLTVATDLQDVASLDDPYRRDFIEHSQIVFCSSVNLPGVASTARALAAAGRVVVVGMGAHGCALATQEGFWDFPPLPGEAEVVDSNGAGDALAVGFLTSYVIEGMGLPESILRAQIAARFVCEQKAPKSLIGPAEWERRRQRF